jgi:hypothetical protein
MTTSEIGEKAKAMREKGIDLRTVIMHFESVQGRALSRAEHDVILDAHRAAEPVRFARERARDQAAADGARERNP